MLLAALFITPLGSLRAIEVLSLRCEYRESPLGVDVAKPRLSWMIVGRKQESGDRGLRQTSYQVLVASSEEVLKKDHGDLWDSGKVESDQSIHVEYQGKQLESRMRCYWKVRIWFTVQGSEEKGSKVKGSEVQGSEWSEPAKWEMGLLKPADWQAKWIGEPAVSAGTNLEGVVINRATYLTLDGKVSADVTPVLKKALEEKRIPFHVDFKALGGDPAPNIVKELVVEYTRLGTSEVTRAQDFQNLTIPKGPVGIPAPWFRGEFSLAGKPESGLVRVHSPAYFELYVNGIKAGDDVLTPAVSHPPAKTFIVTYDVARMLKPGNNCIGLWMAKGWAERIAVRAQLEAVVDGKRVVFGTGPEWKTRPSGYSHIGGWTWNNFGGERIDTAANIPDWCKPGIDTAAWDNAVDAHTPDGAPVSHMVPLNRIGARIPAREITRLENGRYEIDFGTALTGWLCLKMPALAAGTVVKMTFADVRQKDGNYQHFNQVSEFVSAGGAGEIFQHKFNYAGFRYVVVEGLTSAPPKEDAVAMLVESDLESAGTFDCSNELFNRIHRVNQWTQRCLDLGGYYVDCPHRERMGYGDGQVATEGFMTSFNAYNFYRKWLCDWRLRQGEDGALPHMAPFGNGGGGPGWPGLLAAITWRHYLYYGDRNVLEENFDAIRRYVDHLEARCTDNILRQYGDKWDFIGDWVPPNRGMDTKNWPGKEAAELFNNCYRIYQMDLLRKMAIVLGRQDEVDRCQSRLAVIRPAVHALFYDKAAGHYVIDEQAYYVMPLMTGVVPEPERAALLKKLEQNILVKNKGHLDTGMLGTYFMMEYLREIGRNDLVFTMFNQTTHPGWGYMLEQDATTFWEQWNGHWSHIHSCFTSPDNWLYQGLGGIRPAQQHPGQEVQRQDALFPKTYRHLSESRSR